MTVLVILNNLSLIIPSVIGFILCYDLLWNRSLASQYFHWISFLAVGISTASLSGYIISSNLSKSSTQISQRDKQHKFATTSLKTHCSPSKDDLNQAIKKLTKIICKYYINDWSTRLHSGKPDLSLELQDALYQLLKSLFNKLNQIEGNGLLLDFATIFRIHLSRLKNKDSFEKNSNGDPISKQKMVEESLARLLQSLNFHETVSSDLVFDCITKIIAKQVIWNSIRRLSDPYFIHSLFIKDKPEFKNDPIKSPMSPMTESTVKIQTNISEENQNPSSFVISGEPSSPDDVFSTTPMTTNFKLSTDKIDTSETNTRDYSKQSLLERRDSFRLSFHRQGSISSALGNIFNGTAGPLLPDNIAFQSLNKMWRSPSSEKLSLNISREATPIQNEKEDRNVSRGPLSRKGSLSNTLNAIMDMKISRKLSHHEPLISCPPELFKEKIFEPSFDLPGFSSDEESLNYEDNGDLESTIDKLRQLLADKSGETESISSEEAVFQSPSKEFYQNFEITQEDGTENFTIYFEMNGHDGKVSVKKTLVECKDFQMKLEPQETQDSLNGPLTVEALEKCFHHLQETGRVEELRDFLCSSQNIEDIQPKAKTKRGLAKKMTGMINTIKDAFPTFEDEQDALESSNTTTTDGKEDSGPKSFLLPSLFPITTPLNSPRDVSPARNYEIQQRRKVRFQFIKSIQPDKSELEATLDFHVQHWNHSVDNDANFLTSYKKIGVTKPTSNSNLLDVILSTILVDLPEIFLNDECDWLNNQTLHQVIKSCVEEKFENNLDLFVKKNFSTIQIIDLLISWIEGGINEESSDSEDTILGQLTQFMDTIPLKIILKLLGTSTNQVEEKFKQLTSDQRINEDLLVKWFQVSIATLIMFSEEKNG